MPVSAEEKLEYILFCLAHTSSTVNDSFDEVAKLKNVYSGNDARKKFKKYIEECGQYKLDGKAILLKDGPAASVPATPKVTKSSPAKKSPGRVSKSTPKKRKLNTNGEEQAEGEAEEA